MCVYVGGVVDVVECGFLSSVRPVDFHTKVIRCNEWQHRLNTNT